MSSSIKVNVHFECPPECPASKKTDLKHKKGRYNHLPTLYHSKAAFIAFLAAYYSSDTFPLRPQEMSVDCFIIAFLVHIVPFPDNPA